MAHQRKLIRDAVVALLIAANTSAGARVVTTKFDPTPPQQLPTISVYTLSEDIDDVSVKTAPRRLYRQLQLEVACWVAQTATLTVADAMDLACEQVEAAMDASRYLKTVDVPNGLAAETILSGTSMEVIAHDPLVGIVTLTYTVSYQTTYPATAPALDDFLTVDATINSVDGIAGDTAPLEQTINVRSSP